MRPSLVRRRWLPALWPQWEHPQRLQQSPILLVFWRPLLGDGSLRWNLRPSSGLRLGSGLSLGGMGFGSRSRTRTGLLGGAIIFDVALALQRHSLGITRLHQMANDILVHAQCALDLNHRCRGHDEIEEVIQAITMMLDGIGEAATPPGIHTHYLPIVADDGLTDTLNNGSRLVFTNIRVDDKA